ncbi:MAG: hypothetical protein QG655_1060 [Actinomycetota bacterium]|jgi:hypothetical protein|nr:hypothetical protein [Actinomycetota bacterium]
MVLVAVLVIGGAGFTVHRLHGIFGSGHSTATPGGTADEIVPFNPKTVVLEVFGDPGATAMISYTDVDARPQHLVSAALPWSYRQSTTTPAVIVNIMAQSDGNSVGCRIVIDGVVKAQRVVDIPGAYTFCLDKSG